MHRFSGLVNTGEMEGSGMLETTWGRTLGMLRFVVVVGCLAIAGVLAGDASAAAKECPGGGPLVVNASATFPEPRRFRSGRACLGAHRGTRVDADLGSRDEYLLRAAPISRHLQHLCRCQPGGNGHGQRRRDRPVEREDSRCDPRDLRTEGRHEASSEISTGSASRTAHALGPCSIRGSTSPASTPSSSSCSARRTQVDLRCVAPDARRRHRRHRLLRTRSLACGCASPLSIGKPARWFRTLRASRFAP